MILLRRIAAPCCLLLALVHSVPEPAMAQRSVCSRGGMVVSACPIASEVGAQVLGEGGNAVDAAVAVGFALAVTYPIAGNIGGGGFMLVRMNTGDCVCIDYREKAPRKALKHMYLDEAGDVIKDLSTIGHLSVGVPGTVAGLYLGHEAYCTIPWKDLLAPAIALARDGFAVSEDLSISLRILQPYLADIPSLEVFFHPDGSALEPGDTLRQPDLARTLERIALLGPDGFYRGETAELICREMQRGEGLIDEQDLEAYEAVIREPVRGSYRACDIVSAPPPSSGGTILIEILNILEGYPLGELGYLSEETVHVIVEAEKRCYQDRARHLGDPDFTDNHVSTLISKKYAEYRRRSIRQEAVSPSELEGEGIRRFESEETTHYSIVDAAGNAVATTTTLNGYFGSKIMVEDAGFLLNNEMDDFSVKPGIANMYGLTGGEANAIEPGKRMLSSMAPTIVLRNSEPFLVLGTPGGATIITTVAQVIMNIIDFGMSVDGAVQARRFHHQWLPDKIEFEEGAFSDDLIRALEIRGHAVFERSKSIGDMQAIQLSDTAVCGMSDPRGGGRAVAEAAAAVPLR
jgi:gamma-glutamyltranspeptidase/glutathione hydrolase